MPGNDDHSRLQNLGTVIGAPETGLRYMRRRRVGTSDRNGDPLDGIVNLWDVAIVLAVGFLVAALAAVGATGLLTDKNMTIVTNPGTPQMQVIVKQGSRITKLDRQSGQQVAGVGTLLGSFYKLADGTVIYVPAGDIAPSGATPAPGATTAPGVTTTPGAVTTPGATPLPGESAYPSPGESTPPTSATTYPTVTPTPSVTLTPDTGSGIP